MYVAFCSSMKSEAVTYDKALEILRSKKWPSTYWGGSSNTPPHRMWILSRERRCYWYQRITQHSTVPLSGNLWLKTSFLILYSPWAKSSKEQFRIRIRSRQEDARTWCDAKDGWQDLQGNIL